MLFKWSCTTEPTLKTVEQLIALYTLYKYKDMCGAAKHKYGFVKQHNQRIHEWTAKGWSYRKQGKPEGFDSCDPPNDLAKIGSKLWNILSRATLKYEGWLRKTIENLFHVPTGHMCHFRAICEFKFDLRLRNAQMEPNWPPVWPWNLTDDIEKQ